MNFMTAVKVCLTQKYCDFEGRASRSEYWWFQLFCLLIVVIGFVISEKLGWIALAGIALPTISAGVRRLHDTNRSGWISLISFIPFGNCVFAALCALKGTEGPNRFGEDPLGND